jgi:predicted methyltransferase
MSDIIKNNNDAVAWWNSLSSQNKARMLTKHYPNEEWFIVDSSSYRIEAMWLKESKQKSK